MLVVLLMTLISLNVLASDGDDAITDGNFEAANAENAWFCVGCKLAMIRGGCYGKYCAKVADRTDSSASLQQEVMVDKGNDYVFTAQIKMMGDPVGQTFTASRVHLVLVLSDDSLRTISIATLPFTTRRRGWQTLKSAFKVDNIEFSRALIVITLSDVTVPFSVDEVQLRPLTPDANWKPRADERIQQHRKRDFKLGVTVSSEFDPQEITIEITETQPLFGYGTYLDQNKLLGQGSQNDLYRRYFQDNFWWALLSDSIDWENLEQEPEFREAKMLEALLTVLELTTQGKQLYGQSVTSALESKLPDWLEDYQASEFKETLLSHVTDFMENLANRFDCVEVVQDVMDKVYLQERSGDDDIVEEVLVEALSFRDATHTHILISDERALMDANLTQALVDYVETLRRQRVRIDGIGISAAYGEDDEIDIDLIRTRLEILEGCGLPVWVTGLEVSRRSVKERADSYVDLLRVFYSSPAVSGVLLADFWDDAELTSSALVSGDTLVENLAGSRLRLLWQTEWNSSFTLTPLDNSFHVFNLSGYHGVYNVTVKKGHEIIKEESFSLTPDSGHATVEVNPRWEMVNNGDFESVFATEETWHCLSCSLSLSEHESYSGRYSLFTSNRERAWSSPFQVIPLSSGSLFYVSAMVRLHEETSGGHDVTMKLHLSNTHGNIKQTAATWGANLSPAVLPGLQAKDGWTKISAVIRVTDKEIDAGKWYLTIPGPEVNFYIDNVTVRELPPTENWKPEAERKIQQLRKNRADFRIRVSEEYDLEDVTIIVNLTKHLFGYGSTANEYLMTSSSDAAKPYQNYFKDNFWWAAHEYEFYWDHMEKNKGEVNFDNVEACVRVFKENNISVLASNLLAANTRWWPAWLLAASGSQIIDGVYNRMHYISERLNNSLTLVDVNHESLFVDEFERRTGDDDFTKEIFTDYHSMDPAALLMLADKNILTDGSYAQAIINRANSWREAGVPVHAIGVQGSFEATYDIDLIQKRLELLEEADVPVWITPFDVAVEDEEERAAAYVDLITLFYSTPHVDGVILNGFYSNTRCRQHASLVDGDDFAENEAGRRLHDLWHDTWYSELVHNPAVHYMKNISISGFHGDYEVVMYNGDEVVRREEFSLLPGHDATVDINMIPISELMRNGDIEAPLTPEDWSCRACHLEQRSVRHSGLYSIYVTDRSTMWASVQQSVPVRRGGRYHISAHVKLDNLLQDSLYHELQLKLKSKLKNGMYKHTTLASLPRMRPDLGWQKIGAAFMVESYDTDIVEAVVTFDLEPSVSFYLDEVRLREFASDDWRTEANVRIEEQRKSSFTIKKKVSEEYDTDKVLIEVFLAKHSFEFGSTVREKFLASASNSYEAYKRYFFENFWSASVERSLRWDVMEAIEGNNDHSELDVAVDILNNRSIPILASSLFWGKRGKFPSWIYDKTSSEVLSAINSRIDFITQRYSDRLDKLVVTKEHLANDFFEEKIGDADIYSKMIDRIRSTDSQILIEEGNVLKDGTYTQAVVDLVQRLTGSGTYVDGIGVEGFFDGPDIDDPETIKKRIEVLQEAGLPIWITELYVNLASPEQTADAYEDLLRLFFSMEAVEGVLLDDFADLTETSDNSFLVTGPDCEETAVGRRLRRLWKEEWHSHFNLSTQSRGEETVTLRGFHGDYVINMYHDGQLVNSDNFTLRKDNNILQSPVRIAVYPKEEEIVDGDFEGEGVLSAWGCVRCQLELTEDAFAGLHGVMITQRTGSRSYIYQRLDINPAANYHISAFVKVQNLPSGKMYTEFNMRYSAMLQNGGFKGGVIASLPYMQPSHGWRKIEAAFKFTHPGSKITLSFETKDVDVVFLLDEIRMRKIQDDPYWKVKALDRIEKIRKNNITLRMTVSEDFDIDQVEIEMKLRSHAFGYGAVIDAKDLAINRPSHESFMEYFLTNFWWGSFYKDFTWLNMEKTRGELTDSYLADALDVMSENRISAHGYSLLSSKQNELPTWLLSLPNEEIIGEAVERVAEVVTGVGNRFDHMVANSGRLHNPFFENALLNMNATGLLLELLLSNPLDSELFLSDFDILDNSKLTQAAANFARELNRAGLGLAGLSVQTSFSQTDNIDFNILQKRLEILEDAEVPIWVTEFAVARDDVTSRANLFEDLLTLFFSAPNVGGVILKGFWDRERISSNEALAEGADFVLSVTITRLNHENEVGRRMRHLWDRQWTTREVIRPQTHGHQAYDLRGFYGDYDIIMRHNGDVIKQQSFTLSPGETLDLYVDVYPQNEMILNPGFEGPLSDAMVGCISCDILHVNDSYKGSKAVYVTNRTEMWNTVSQSIHAVSGKKYYASLMLKLDNNEATTSHAIFFNIRMDELVLGKPSRRYMLVSLLPRVTAEEGWVKVSGTFTAGQGGDEHGLIVSPLVYVDNPAVSFFVDEYTMHEIIQHDDWREKANQRIITHRTNKLSIGVEVSSSYDPRRVRIEVELKRHAFPFGAAVTANIIRSNNPDTQKYRDYFYDNFWYAVFQNAFKWHLLEVERNNHNYDRVDEALNELDKHNISTRGHCMFWANGEKNIPAWLYSMDADDVRSEIHRRIDQTATKYKRRFAHYDVNNEQLHSDFFEKATKDPDITMIMFERIHAIDPDVELFTNDFNILSYGQITQASVNQVLKYKARGTPIHGIGAQSHFRSSGSVDVDHVLRRLDILAEARVPVWVTELDVNMDDYSDCAQAYEDLLRTMFSHPIVEGIIMWGFWDEDHLFPFCPHVVGENLTLTDSGRVIQRLWREEWHTHVTIEPRSREPELHIFDAFHGTYDMKVFYEDSLIKTDTFEVHKGEDAEKTIAV